MENDKGTLESQLAGGETAKSSPKHRSSAGRAGSQDSLSAGADAGQEGSQDWSFPKAGAAALSCSSPVAGITITESFRSFIQPGR